MGEKNYSSVGERLKQERERLGLTQEQLAQLAGHGKGTQINYEGGKTSPTVDYLLAVAAHGVDTVYVLTGSRSATVGALNAEESLLVDNYRAATDGGRAAARAVLDAVEKQLARPAKRAVGE